MPRTSITPTLFGANAGTTPVATTIDGTLVTAGVSIAARHNGGKLLIRITNTHGADHIATIPAGDDPPAFQSAAIAVSVPATTGVRYIGPLDSAKVAQDDGTVYVDFVTNHAGVIEVYELPQGY